MQNAFCILHFCINPALQAFPPSHLGIVQASLPSALGLSSVLHLLSFRSHLHSYERPVADDYRRVVVRGVLEFETLAEFAVR